MNKSLAKTEVSFLREEKYEKKPRENNSVKIFSFMSTRGAP